MIPFNRDFNFSYGKPTQVTPSVRRVIANNPGPFTFTGTGTYLIGNSEGVAVIDPGPPSQEHLDAVLAAALGPIRQILITHTHLDHSAAAPALSKMTGAPILGFSAHGLTEETAPPAFEEGADFTLRLDETLSDGDDIQTAGYRLRAVHTPGHTDNHLCFALNEEGLLFTGDHIMGWSTSVVAPPDGNMADYMASLERLLQHECDQLYLPTHGAPIEQPKAFVRQIKAHRLARDEQILAALSTTPQSPLEIAKIVYGDIGPQLLQAAAFNVLAHLEQHVGKDGFVCCDAGRFWKARK